LSPWSQSVSTNWAGYVVGGAHGAVRHFQRVTGTWVQPAVTCTPGTRAYSAFWVGLGGLATSSRALEQTGTEADCDVNGGAHYTAWYELVPAGPVTTKLTIAPGDTIKAIVSVAGQEVTITLNDLTSRKSVTKKLRASQLDTTSAEWIAEAPSDCNGNNCQPLPLSDFNSVTFKSAAAELANGHSGSISSSYWAATSIALNELSGASFGGREFGPRALVTAVPTTLGPAGSSFAISWAQQQQYAPGGPGGRFFPGG
jgi:hypothetical protein